MNDPAESLFQPFAGEAVVSSSGVGRDIHSLTLSIQHFLRPPRPRSGELPTQKLKSHLTRTQSLKVLPLKLGIGQYMACDVYCQGFLPC